MIKTTIIEDEIIQLKEQLQMTEKELKGLKKNVPSGAKLHASHYRQSYQFFLRVDKKEKKGRYIRKADQKIVETLSQIEYDEKLILVLQKAISELERYKQIVPENVFEDALIQISPGKRPFVHMPFISDECFIKQWKAQEFEQLGFAETSAEYYSSSGLRVRSKSEIIIADMLDEFQIPFIYEKPLLLKIGFVHPDFTLLNISEKKEVYWEHFGMMGDMEYQNNAFGKIRAYEGAGLFQGDSLICTFETERQPINTKDLRRMMELLKKKLGY